MRLPELCLALLYAAGTATEPPRAARERPLAPGAAVGRGVPGAARVDPRQAWMLLAGSPDRGRGRTGAHTAPAGAGSPGKSNSAAPASPTMPEELLRELQLLLRGMAKMCRTAGEGCKEESSKGSPEAGAQHRVEAAFHCQTSEDIAVEQKMWQELGLFYIPEREGMFHRGPGLNLTSGQYTAPIAGYYAFTTTLHIARREPRRKGQGWRQSRLRVLICVQSRCQHNSHLETVSRLESSSDLFTISVMGTLYLQAGQYASVFVDNTAGSPLTVRSGSDFSAVLLGV
ncbi:PREDICTED: erythroferrone [Sturnus vulgaris]|uniref:erythroferrone n=1 Tax=Sturnus vulgaris TaxID=9172 RepID=UPI00071A6613|nr:PREDICTED: erythroferrone [Sturnus vulgaris]